MGVKAIFESRSLAATCLASPALQGGELQFNPDPQTIASRSLGYLKGILEAFTQ